MSKNYETTNWWEMISGALLAAIFAFCRCLFAMPIGAVVIIGLVCIVLMPSMPKPVATPPPPSAAQPVPASAMPRPVTLKDGHFVPAD